MRGFDRDLIRGGHYGQRSYEPHLKGRTHGCTDQLCDVKILLANSEPSTHGTKRTSRPTQPMSAFGGKADMSDLLEDGWQSPPAARPKKFWCEPRRAFECESVSRLGGVPRSA